MEEGQSGSRGAIALLLIAGGLVLVYIVIRDLVGGTGNTLTSGVTGAIQTASPTGPAYQAGTSIATSINRALPNSCDPGKMGVLKGGFECVASCADIIFQAGCLLNKAGTGERWAQGKDCWICSQCQALGGCQ